MVNPRPFDIRLLGTLPVEDNGIDDMKQPEVAIRQTDKTVYRKSRNWFDETQGEMIFKKCFITRNKQISRIPKKKVIHDYNIPISIKELSAQDKKSPFFKGNYRYIKIAYSFTIKGRCFKQIEGRI